MRLRKIGIGWLVTCCVITLSVAVPVLKARDRTAVGSSNGHNRVKRSYLSAFGADDNDNYHDFDPYARQGGGGGGGYGSRRRGNNNNRKKVLHIVDCHDSHDCNSFHDQHEINFGSDHDDDYHDYHDDGGDYHDYGGGHDYHGDYHSSYGGGSHYGGSDYDDHGHYDYDYGHGHSGGSSGGYGHNVYKPKVVVIKKIISQSTTTVPTG